jgi:hypothetical protein
MPERTIINRFELSGAIKGEITFGFIIFSIGFVGSIIMCFVDPILMLKLWWMWIPVIIGYSIFVKMFFSAWKERKYFITIDESAIAVNSDDKQLDKLEWSDVIQIKESHLGKRIILFGKYDQLIKLEYQLENFHELILYAIERMDHLIRSFPNSREFHKSYLARILLGILFILSLGLTYVSISSVGFFLSTIFIAISIVLLYILIEEFTYIQINDRKVIIKSPLKKISIEKSEVKEVILETLNNGKRDSFPVINLKLRTSNDIKLFGFKEGTIPLYCSIRSTLGLDS